MQDDPFAELGLPALAELTDDDVRAAWRRIAAATHPDREDGGDPARFGAAAAAYVLLKTPFGRGEALADLGGAAAAAASRRRANRRARSAGHSWRARRLWHVPRSRDPQCSRDPQRRGAHERQAAASSARFRHAGSRQAGFSQAVYAKLGQAGYARYRLAGYVTVDRGLALPAGAAALGAAAAIAVVGWTPATIGLVAGALTVTAWGLWRRAWRDR